MGCWSSVGCEFYLVFLIFSTHKNQETKRLKTHPFPLGIKRTGSNDQGRGILNTPTHDETYQDVKKSECSFRGRVAQGRTVQGHNVRGRIILVPLIR
jgi:hypothetical protein